jgi:hypothetical protein
MLLKHFWEKTILSLSLVVIGTTNMVTREVLAQSNNDNPPSSVPDVIVDTTPTSNPNSSIPSTTVDTTSNINNPRFTCEFVNGQHTVMYRPENRPNQAYPWAIPGRMGGGWTPEKRCQEITRRLESYRPDGLAELRIGQENNYNVLCATTDVEPSCRIVLTVPPNQNPETVRNLVFENLLTADSGTQTYGINTFTGRNSSSVLFPLGNILNPNARITAQSSEPKPINLKPFLSPSDGGSGENIEM